MSTVASGLPALFAVILGSCIYVAYLPWWSAVAAVIVGIAAVVMGRKLLSSSPVIAALVISLWILTGIGVMALCTVGLLWLGLNISRCFPHADASTLKEVSAAVTGAVTTFVGLVITKDMEGGRGFFWPSTQFKSGVQKLFASGPRQLPLDSKEMEAVYDDRVRDNGPIGWGFRARFGRARILSQYFKNFKSEAQRATALEGEALRHERDRTSSADRNGDTQA